MAKPAPPRVTHEGLARCDGLEPKGYGHTHTHTHTDRDAVTLTLRYAGIYGTVAR